MDQPDNLVLLATFPGDVEAHIAAGMLEANGIATVLDNQLFSSLYPIGFNSIGQVRMMVRAADYSRANELLLACRDE